MQREDRMKILMINAVLLFCCFCIGHAVENKEAMHLAISKLEWHYMIILQAMRNPDDLAAPSTVLKYSRQINGMPEIEFWSPQKEAQLLEEAGVSAQQLCESPNKDTQSTMFLKLARAFNLVYSTWFRLRSIELHKSAVLHNERELKKLMPKNIEKYLGCASKANKRSEIHRKIYLEYDNAIANKEKIFLLQEEKLPAYKYVDDKKENLKVLFKATLSFLKSEVRSWDVAMEMGQMDSQIANWIKVTGNKLSHWKQISDVVEKWEDKNCKEWLELSKEFNFYEMMRHHSKYLQMSEFAQYHKKHDFIKSNLYEQCDNSANIAMKLSKHHEELYKKHQKALESYETKTDNVKALQRDLETAARPESVEEGFPEMAEIGTSSKKLRDDNYVVFEINKSDSNSANDLDLNLCLGLDGMKRWHDTIEIDSVQSKKRRLNTESYFDGIHESKRFNFDENNDLDLNLCLGVPQD